MSYSQQQREGQTIDDVWDVLSMAKGGTDNWWCLGRFVNDEVRDIWLTMFGTFYQLWRERQTIDDAQDILSTTKGGLGYGGGVKSSGGWGGQRLHLIKLVRGYLLSYKFLMPPSICVQFACIKDHLIFFGYCYWVCWVLKSQHKLMVGLDLHKFLVFYFLLEFIPT